MDDETVAALQAAVNAYGGILGDVDDDDCVKIGIGDITGTIYLDNIRRRVSGGDKLEDVVEEFVKALLTMFDLPSDPMARRAGLRLMLEQRVTVESFPAIFRQLSSEVVLALEWIYPEGEKVLFLTPDDLVSWNLTEQDAWSEAERQMDLLLAITPIEVSYVGESRVAMLATGSIFKASLIAAPSLRQTIEPTIGWPVHAMIPCRDFLYMFPLGARELMRCLGRTVLREFNESPYPLSTEVFSISDEGIKAIGRFSEPEAK